MAETQLVAINDFLIDCSLNETHTFESQVTEYPVESGSNITDNIRPMPITIEMECLVSNSPIGLMATFRNTITSPDNEFPPTKPSEDAYEMLQRIRSKREPVTIRTSLRTYTKMALKSLTIPRSGKSGDDLRFTATFQQIDSVENKRSIRVSTPNGNGKKKIAKGADPLDMRQIIIDTKHRVWWDPDFSTWREWVTYVKDSERVDTTFTTTVTDTSKWHLFRGGVLSTTVHQSSIKLDLGQESAKDDPFDTTRWTPPHPLNQQLVVTLSQCVLHGFTIKKALPTGNESNNNRVLKNRSL